MACRYARLIRGRRNYRTSQPGAGGKPPLHGIVHYDVVPGGHALIAQDRGHIEQAHDVGPKPLPSSCRPDSGENLWTSPADVHFMRRECDGTNLSRAAVGQPRRAMAPILVRRRRHTVQTRADMRARGCRRLSKALRGFFDVRLLPLAWLGATLLWRPEGGGVHGGN
jgi:hypothetical protein